MARGVAAFAKEIVSASPETVPQCPGDPGDPGDGVAAGPRPPRASSTAPPHAHVGTEQDSDGRSSGPVPRAREGRKTAGAHASTGMLALVILACCFCFTFAPRHRREVYYPGSPGRVMWPPWLAPVPDFGQPHDRQSPPPQPTPPPSHAGLADDFHDCEGVWDGLAARVPHGLGGGRNNGTNDSRHAIVMLPTIGWGDTLQGIVTSFVLCAAEGSDCRLFPPEVFLTWA